MGEITHANRIFVLSPEVKIGKVVENDLKETACEDVD
jgi:hypothetical protein